jgi:hypothetical protein
VAVAWVVWISESNRSELKEKKGPAAMPGLSALATLAPIPDNCPNKSNFVARRFSCPQPALSCKLPSDLLRRLAMKAFLLACAAAIVIAAAGFVVLDQVQEPVQQAFATTGVRL